MMKDRAQKALCYMLDMPLHVYMSTDVCVQLLAALTAISLLSLYLKCTDSCALPGAAIC